MDDYDRVPVLKHDYISKNNNRTVILKNKDFSVFAIAENKGEFISGKPASEIAKEEIESSLKELDNMDKTRLLKSIFSIINKRIYQLNKYEPKAGTILLILIIENDRYFIANVGNIRCFLIRNNKILQITSNSDKELLTDIIGTKSSIIPDIYSDNNTLQKNDILLLCSDGLCKSLKQDKLLEILTNNEDQDIILNELVNTAQKNNPIDNISALIINFDYLLKQTKDQEIDHIRVLALENKIKDIERNIDYLKLQLNKITIDLEDYKVYEKLENKKNNIIKNTPEGHVYIPSGKIFKHYLEPYIKQGQEIYIGKYPVIQEDYERLMGYNPSSFKGKNLPVENITYYDAISYCNLKSKEDGLSLYYSIKNTEKDINNIINAEVEELGGNGWRLPKLREWAYCACGGENANFTLYSGSDDINDVAWYKDNSNSQTHPVGEKIPNEFGIYDMTGNIREWTKQLMDLNGKGKKRIVIKGGYADDQENCKLPIKYSTVEDYFRSSFLGFRIVRYLSFLRV